MATRHHRTLNDLPLFATDEDIGEAVLGYARRKEFKGLATLVERHGMPKISPLWGGRYVPAVKAFLDFDNGLGGDRPLALAPDGVEGEWPTPNRNRRQKGGPALDGNERWPKGDGKVEVIAPDGRSWIEVAQPTDPKSWQKKRELKPRTPPA